MNREEMLSDMRQLEDKQLGAELSPQEVSYLEYLRADLYPLRPSEMTDAELDAFYEGEFDEPNPKYGMRMSGKGTRRVNEVLSGRAIY